MPDLLPANTWTADPALGSLLRSWLRPQTLTWAEPALDAMGRAAAGELQEWGDACERQPAQLRVFDGWGNRIDDVVYPDAWRRIAASAARSGLVALPYEASPPRTPQSLASHVPRGSRGPAGPPPEGEGKRPGSEARIVQAALCYLFAPSTATYLCPVAMTDGAARVLADYGSEADQRRTLAHLLSRDSANAWTSGQWMTERQGGSDVGRNAVLAKRDGDHWRLYGQKFFCSNIGCEVALALARPEGAPAGTRGLALFLVPRDHPSGRRNDYRIDRLKDKLGTRAMATGEVTLDGAYAQLLGEAGRGFAEMTAMLNITRLHNAVTAAAIMRRAWMLASAYAGQREAFGRTLDRHPLHQEVLRDLEVQADRALYLTMRMAQLLGCIEKGQATDEDQALFRLGIALAKLYTGKQAVAAASEAIECFGGQGYMEDTGLPRLLRDAQVLPIWEGTTNVLSLDALRVIRKPGTIDALSAELERQDAPDHKRLLETARKSAVDESDTAERTARRLAMGIAESWSAGLLDRYGTNSPPRSRAMGQGD